jgi:hypothetical protein
MKPEFNFLVWRPYAANKTSQYRKGETSICALSIFEEFTIPVFEDVQHSKGGEKRGF